MATERITVKPGANFDPTNPAHLDAVLKNIAEKTAHGTGWKMQSYNPDDHSITLTRQSAVTQVSKSTKKTDSYDVGLSAGTKPADGDQIAAKLESDPRHEGYVMTAFQPFLGQATLSKMTPASVNARGAVAVALGVKPWDVQVSPRKDGGFSLVLPRSYVPSKHDVKLLEVATTNVGRDGWFVQVDPQKLTAEIIPSDPPTFEPAYKFDFAGLPNAKDMTSKELWTIPLGVGLGKPGEPNALVKMDLSDAVGSLLVGLAGSGKSVATQAIAFSALARGWQLALINTVDKATDFVWAKPFVRENMWGCDTVAQAVTVAKLVAEEGEKRGALLSEFGVSKWQDLPAKVRAENPPLLLIADELAALLTADPLPSGLTKEMKELPEFIKMQQDLLESKLLATALSKIPAVYRAAGIRAIYLTQQPNERYGFSTKLKGNLSHRTMLGVSPSQAEKGHAFRTPEKVPDVPSNIAQDDSLSRGVGLTHLDGQEPVVFKGFYAPLEAYLAEAKRRGFPVTSRPEPTARQIERLVPRIGDSDLDEPPSRMRDEVGGFGRDERRGPREDGLSGAAAAAHDAVVEMAAAKRAQADDVSVAG